MDEHLQHILNELYALDPTLRRHEAALIQTVQALIAARPTTEFTETFRDQLRNQLLVRAHELTASRTERTESMSIFNLITMKKFYFAIGGAALALVVIVTALIAVPGGRKLAVTPQNVSPTDESFNALSVTKIADRGFGALQTAGGGGQGRSAAIGMGGGGGGGFAAAPAAQSETDSKVAAPEAGGDATSLPSPIMPPDYLQYKFIYQGGDITLEGDTVEVLRRVKGMGSRTSLSQLLRSFNLSGINLASFGDSVVRDINFTQNKQYGYSVYVGIAEGMLSISENWEQWYPPCGPNGCTEQPRISMDQIPKDAELIALADAFLKEHQVDVSSYGKPFVQDDWRFWYDQAPNKSEFYLPDAIMVVYPLMVNGKQVYDEGGNETGLKVNVNVRFKRVSGLYEFTTQQYESSSYGAVTDSAEVLKIAEQGGLYGYYPVDGARIAEVPLGSPTMGLLKMWNYRNGTNDELLVPALIFPVTKQPGGNGFYRKNVVVPLAKELIQNQPPFQIMEKAR